MFDADADAEEPQDISRLLQALEPEQLESMRNAARTAESKARPRPGMKSAATNMPAGPFAAMLDRARDALTDKNC